MAYDFTLTKTRDEALPEAVEVDGNVFSINASFRIVLKILRVIEADDILDWQKPFIMLNEFFGKNQPEPQAGIDAFMRFLYRDKVIKRESTDRPPAFDYEIDAQEIYASFLILYGIDLLDSDIHWWQFCALLDGAIWADSPIGKKVRRREELRKADPSKCDDPQAVREAQEALRLDTKLNRAEQEERDRIYKVLTGGGDVSAELEKLKHGV